MVIICIGGGSQRKRNDGVIELVYTFAAVALTVNGSLTKN